jgi:hypothetical protein
MNSRRMFPSLRIKVTGLEENLKYAFVIDIQPYDNNRYKFQNGEWVCNLMKDDDNKKDTPIVYKHPDSMTTGASWMKQIISFHKLKLTNNSKDSTGLIKLNSMHKYVPCIYILEENRKTVNKFSFTQTTFMAVTSYQNEMVNKFKLL